MKITEYFTTDLKIGSDRLGSDDFKGFIFQIRVYCGGYLTDDDFQTLQSAGAQQMTQKISGNVWKRKDTLKNITVEYTLLIFKFRFP